MNYYDQNGPEFIENTLALNLTPIYTRFEKYLSYGSKILDIGCGPGRDLKYFSKIYQATGLEPSTVLAQYARAFCGCKIIESRVQDYSTNEKFDGIWACASLLHLPSTELLDVFQKIPISLTPMALCIVRSNTDILRECAVIVILPILPKNLFNPCFIAHA
jgi:SAM-dependent methyltransferase